MAKRDDRPIDVGLAALNGNDEAAAIAFWKKRCDARKAAWNVDKGVLEKDQALVDKILPTVDASVRSAYPS
jgi:hypothetical protein